MGLKMNQYLKTIFLCSVLISAAGCVEAIAYLPDLISAGVGVVDGLENVDVKAACSPGITTTDLQKVKKVAVVLGAGMQTNTNPYMSFPMGGEDFTHVMADNITLELMTLGYQVIERTSLEKVLSEQKLQLSGITDPTTAARVGKILGIDAVVLGNVTTSYNSRQKQVVSNATMKVVGVEQANVILVVALSYKHGQQPTEASKTMALALSEKLKNPSGTAEKKASKE